MKAQESRRIRVAGFLFMAGILAVALWLSRQNLLVSDAQDQSEQLVLPIADYYAPEPLQPEDKARRLKRNKRYDHQSGEAIKESSYPVERIWSAHWAQGIPPLPFSQSDLIIIGTVLSSQANLSADNTGIYSEFGIYVEEVLKGNGTSAVNEPIVSIERIGGAVRFPSGVIQKYRTSGQGMPRQGRRYVLFLKKIDQDDDFLLVTGYELRGQNVGPLDGSTQQGNQPLQFDSFKGTNVSLFLRALRDAITKASPMSQAQPDNL